MRQRKSPTGSATSLDALEPWSCEKDSRHSTKSSTCSSVLVVFMIGTLVLVSGLVYSTMDKNQRLHDELTSLQQELNRSGQHEMHASALPGSLGKQIRGETSEWRDKNRDANSHRHSNNRQSQSNKESELLLSSQLTQGTYGELWNEYFACPELYAKPRPIPTQDSWMLLRGIYYGMFHTHESESSGDLEKLMTSSSMKVPFAVKYVEGKGRGIFAEEDIAKGSLIFSAFDGGHLHFATGYDFRKFLGTLTREQSCEVLQCSAVENHGSREDPRNGAVITADLDFSCFVNTCNNKEEINAGCIEGRDCVNNDYALRDIKAGEEIVMNYSDYAFSHGWSWFGL